MIMLFSLLWTVFSCQPENSGSNGSAGKDSVSFDLSEVSIAADAGKAVANLTANGPWHVVSMPDWLGYVRPESGSAGTAELTFGGRFHDGDFARSGEVKVACGKAEATIKIVQEAHVSMEVYPGYIDDFPAEGGIAELEVKSTFKPLCDVPEWIHFSLSEVSGGYKVTLEIEPNPGEARSAFIVFHNESGIFKLPIEVSQKGNALLVERNALAELYKSTGGQSWSKSDNWCSDKPLSSWFGVTVGTDGHVTGLDLSKNNLEGSLPAAITELTELKELYLYGNRLSGSLPEGMRLMPGWSGFSAVKHIYPQQEGFGFSSKDSEVAQYQRASNGKGIDIVILGDAFDKSGLELGKGFDALVEKAIEAIFALEPMKSCRSCFNVYSVSAESTVSEISTNAANTAFGTYFTSSDFTVVTMNTNWEKVFQYVGKSPAADIRNSVVLLLANTERFGGTTLSWDDGRRLSIVPDFKGGAVSTEAKYGFAGLIQHEVVGHAFGLFDEEYHTNGLTAPESFAADLAVRQAKGVSLNISSSPDLAKAPWSDLASSYPEIGVFEGAGNYSYGAYRSESDCCMVDNRPYFSAWCRYLLWKRIRTLQDEDASLEAFIKFDKQ